MQARIVFTGSIALVSAAVFAASSPTASADVGSTQTNGATATKSCGEGACKRTVSIAMQCVPGQPITADDGWLYKADPATGSWDANCDGQVEKKPPPNQLSSYAIDCQVQRGGGCVAKAKTVWACGEKAPLFDKCVESKTADGKTTCHGNVLKGEYAQACR